MASPSPNLLPHRPQRPLSLANLFATLNVLAILLWAASGLRAQESGPDLTWPAPTSIVYGTPLSAGQLNASHPSNLPGDFVYTPDFGTVLAAGVHNLSVTFVPSDETLATQTASVNLTVTKAPLIVRADDKTAFYVTDQGGADVTEFVHVGDPGNPAQKIGNDSVGSVFHTFDLAKHEVTNNLYVTFLNAVAKDDPFNADQFAQRAPLFNPLMEEDSRGGIVRHGDAPNFSYSVKPNMGNKPVNFVSFWDACRFCNWLHNGMPEGPQTASTTENGAYDLTNLEAMTANTTRRRPGARYFIPTESEWHKAAFYDADRSAYFAFATGNDEKPTPAKANSQGDISNPGGNVANFGRNADWDSNGNGRVENGAIGGHLGPEDGNVTSVGSGGSGNQGTYGGADMGGNVSEWTETPLSNWGRMTKGGNWNGPVDFLHTGYRFPFRFPFEVQDIGFRIGRPGVRQTELPVYTVSYYGFVNGDRAAQLTTRAQVIGSASPSSPPGSYAITPFGASSPNYELVYQEGTLLLNDKGNATLQWTKPADIVYGTPLSTIQLNARPVIDGIEVPGTLSYNPPAGTVLPAGSHDLHVTFQPADPDNYNPISFKTEITVLRAPLTIQALNSAREVDHPNPAFTATFAGFVNGDTAASLWRPVRLRTTATPTSPPGQYPILAEAAFSPNYNVSFVDGTLTVLSAGRILPQINWTPASLTYGQPLGAEQLNATVTGNIAGTFSYDPPPGAVVGAGPAVPLSVTFHPTDLNTYAPASRQTSLAVAKAPLTIQIDNHLRAVGQPNPQLTARYQGFVNGDSVDVLDSPLILSTTATLDSPAGDYSIIGSIGLDNNYAITIFPGILRVTSKLVPEFTWPAPAPITYGQPLGITQLNASVTGGVEGVWTFDPPAGRVLPVGTHVLDATFTPANLDAFESVSASVEITVQPAPLRIRALDVERPIAQPNPSLRLAYEGFVNGQSEEDLLVPPQVTTDATQESPPGAYVIRVTNASDPNYSITLENGILTVVDKIIPEVIWATAPLVYGDPLGAGQLGARVAGDIPGTFTYAPPAGTFLNPGLNQTLSVTFTPEDLTRYEVTTSTTEVDVVRASLTIRIDDLSRRPGIANPTLTATYDGFVRGEGPGDLDNALVLTTEANLQSAPGEYAITGTIGADAHYLISVVPGTLTVTEPTTPSLSWPAPASLTYGQALSQAQLNATVQGQVAGTLTYTPTAGTRLPAGQHRLTVNFTPSNAAAYRETSATVMLTVNPAPLLIRALDAERPQGTENPAFTVEYEGFIEGESANNLTTPPTVVTEATVDSPPGTYPLLVEGAVSPNYAITTEAGVLTVTESGSRELPPVEVTQSQGNLVLTWDLTADFTLFVSEDMVTWSEASTRDQVTSQGKVTARYGLGRLLELGDRQLFFRLQGTE